MHCRAHCLVPLIGGLYLSGEYRLTRLLRSYRDDGRLSIDNEMSERGMMHVALGQKLVFLDRNTEESRRRLPTR